MYCLYQVVVCRPGASSRAYFFCLNMTVSVPCMRNRYAVDLGLVTGVSGCHPSVQHDVTCMDDQLYFVHSRMSVPFHHDYVRVGPTNSPTFGSYRNSSNESTFS